MNKKAIITKSLAVVLSLITLLNVVNVGLVYSEASFNSGNYDLQGNPEALGSPILNTGFQYDDWNKWEFIVWGIFLSNFTIPMVDDYESAFSTTSSSGSKGAGYQALLFGAAADPESRANLQGLLKEATILQKTGPTKRIWVSYSKLDEGVIVEVNDLSGQGGSSFDSNDTSEETDSTDGEGEADSEEEPSNARPDGESLVSEGSGARIATINDLFYKTWADENKAFALDNTSIEAESSDINLGIIWPREPIFTSNSSTYPDLYGIRKGSVPTFYIETSSGYTKVLDFTDPWDSVMISSWVSKMVMDAQSSSEAVANIDSMVSANLPIELDCFGNIVVQKDGNKVVFPAAANQHLTESPRRSLVNSLVLNGRLTNIPGKNYVINGGKHNADAGVPAFQKPQTGIPGGTTVIYYDTDSIIMRDALAAAGGGKRAFYGLMGSLPDAIHTGKAYTELFGTSLENAQFSTLPLKVEVVGLADNVGTNWFAKWPGNKDFSNTFRNTMTVSGQIPNQTLDHTTAPYLTTIKNIQGGKPLELFNDGRIVAVQMKEGTKDGKLTVDGMNRLFIDWINSAFNKESRQASGTVNKESITALLSTDAAKKYKSIWEQLMTQNGARSDRKYYSRPLVNFLVEHSEQYTLDRAPADIVGRELKNNNLVFSDARDILKSGNHHTTKVSVGDSGDMANYMIYGRLVKVFPGSNVALEVNRVLGVREGAQFATYSTAVYLTYLEWYGILDGINKSPRTSYLNTHIFEEGGEALNKNIEDMVDAMSEEDKKRSVLDNSYLLLHPTLGRNYRNNLIMTSLTDWVYSTYMNIVYGKATSYNANMSNQVNTRHASGFLSTPPYSENFMTSAFLKIYPRIAQWLLGAALIMIVVMGLLRRRKLSWFILTFILAVNTILLVPAAGEITPYIANNIVQRMFLSKMTYWAISEGVENAKIEDRFLENERNNANYVSAGLSESEKQQVLELVKTFSVLNVDRSLAVRHDISKKVTNTDLGNLSDVQRLSTARWMLPMIMRQFNAAAGNYDYVYIPLADINDNATNLYLYWNIEMAFNTDTASSGQVVTTVNESGEEIEAADIPNGKIQNVYGRKRSHKGYIDIVSTTYIAPGADELDDAWDEPEQTFRAPIRSVYNADTLSYTGFYILTSEVVGQDFEVQSARKSDGYFDGEDAYQKYLDNLMGGADSVRAKYESINTFVEQNSSYYNMYDRGTMQGHFGYFWLTESNFPYFYLSIKDNTELYPSKHGALTLGRLVGTIQGKIGTNINGERVRTDTWMHYKDTGYIRDFLDMEELFTNVIPYVYLSQVTTGGFGGDTGILGDRMIKDYKLYENNKASWMYRSNWVTKIMESPEYRRSDLVTDKYGNKHEVAYPLEVSAYPADRPMVFSEAQMYEEGLTEKDLCLVELKILEINREVAERWTLLLNYSGLASKGLTKEVIQRQMAIEATMAFNKAFSPDTLLSSERMLYPSGIDLRAISFDTVMKMIMLNVTRDTSFIYGDTMRTIINDSDIFTALLMLFAAFLCAYLIPLARTVVLGLLFYLTFAALIGAIATSHKAKLRVSFGVLLTNLLFLLTTLVYYAAFALMTSLNSPDSVLNPEMGSVQIGNPVWAFIAIIAISLLYCFAMVKFIGFCFKNYKDMGMAAFQQFAMIAKETIGNGLQSLGNINFGGDSNETNSTTNTESIRGTGAGASGDGVNAGTAFTADDERELQENPEEHGDSGYTTDEEDPTGFYDESSSIDAEIDRGRTISKDYDYEKERLDTIYRADLLDGNADNSYLLADDGRVIKTNLETHDADGNARSGGVHRISNEEADRMSPPSDSDTNDKQEV